MRIEPTGEEMTLSEDDARLMTASFDKLSREIVNLHRDVTTLTKHLFPDAQLEKRSHDRWPPIKDLMQVAVALQWLSNGCAETQSYVSQMSARLDAIVNDAHSYDEMKKHLIRQRSPKKGLDG